jgi:hypothetical protein
MCAGMLGLLQGQPHKDWAQLAEDTRKRERGVGRKPIRRTGAHLRLNGAPPATWVSARVTIAVSIWLAQVCLTSDGASEAGGLRIRESAKPSCSAFLDGHEAGTDPCC